MLHGIAAATGWEMAVAGAVAAAPGLRKQILILDETPSPVIVRAFALAQSPVGAPS